MTIKRFSNPDKYFNLAADMAKGTGGVITSSGGYTYHTFTVEDGFETSSFTSPINRNVEVLAVAGGGQGGGQVGGGGGAGGLIYNASYSVTANTPISINVGRGGTTQEHSAYGGGGGSRVSQTPGFGYSSYGYSQQVGSRGDNSVFGTMTASGGGGGAGYSSTYINASSGGSGGGGSNNPNASATQTSNGGGTGYGYAGGTGLSSTWCGGGGGGAGGVGSNGSSANSGTGGVGGIGLQYFGSWYAEGGSGCSNGPAGRINTTRRLGGFGGHSNSGSLVYAQRSGDGKPGTGSGGGGARDNDRIGLFANVNPNGNLDYVGFGGSGIVIVRYI